MGRELRLPRRDPARRTDVSGPDPVGAPKRVGGPGTFYWLDVRRVPVRSTDSGRWGTTRFYVTLGDCRLLRVHVDVLLPRKPVLGVDVPTEVPS